MTENEKLLTPDDVAKRFAMEKRRFMELRAMFDWPHVRLGRNYRFTEEQVAEIIRQNTYTPEPREEEQIRPFRLTPRSAARARPRN